MERIAVINGLRGLAILGVLHVHTLGGMTPPGTHTIELFGIDFSLGSAHYGGWLGVNLFFMLSGFVLYLPFADGREIDTRRFYARRAARLLPLYYIVAFVSIFFATTWDVASWAFWHRAALTVTGTFFWLPSSDPWSYTMPHNGALWSLAIEFVLSLLLPALVIAVRRYGFLILVVPLWALLPVFRWLYFEYSPTMAIPEEHRLPVWHSVITLHALSEFLIGMALAGLWRSGRLRIPAAGVVFVGSCLSVLVALALYDTKSQHVLPPGNFVAVTFWWLIDPLLALIVASALCLRWPYLLTNWPLQLVGMMCYSIYVWHGMLLRHIGPFPGAVLEALPPVLATWLFLIGFGALSYTVIEFPGKPLRVLFMLPVRGRLCA